MTKPLIKTVKKYVLLLYSQIVEYSSIKVENDGICNFIISKVIKYKEDITSDDYTETESITIGSHSYTKVDNRPQLADKLVVIDLNIKLFKEILLLVRGCMYRIGDIFVDNIQIYTTDIIHCINELEVESMVIKGHIAATSNGTDIKAKKDKIKKGKSLINVIKAFATKNNVIAKRLAWINDSSPLSPKYICKCIFKLEYNADEEGKLLLPYSGVKITDLDVKNIHNYTMIMLNNGTAVINACFTNVDDITANDWLIETINP